MFSLKFKKLFLVILSIIFLGGCVGTIKEVDNVEQSIIKQNVLLKFAGVSTCNAISDQKVEVSFDPAYILDGDVKLEDLIYKVFVNGNFDNSVSSMMAKNLRINSLGRYFLEVSGLTLNTQYSFTVRAQDPASGAQDENIISCSVRTLSSKLPIFDGIQEIVPYPGVEGQTSLLLKWNTAKAAEYLLGGIPASGYKISKYNVYQSTSSDNSDSMILLTTLNESSSNPVTQFQVSGLAKGQNYYYMIRAVDESGREDKNRIILAGRTSTPQSVLFEGIKKLDTPTSASGYTSLRANWTVSPEGDFNTFRVFAVPETSSLFNSSSIDPNDSTYMVGDSSSTTIKTYLITGLAPNTAYAVYVVACMADENGCVTKSGDKIKIIGKTTPELAPFAGVSDVISMEGAAGLSNATVAWAAPGVSSGVCEGIKLYESDKPVKSCNDSLLVADEACINNSTISCSSSSVAVSNLKEGRQYCFSAKVFEQSRFQEGDASKKCITTKFDSPIFQSTPTCTALEGGGKIKIDWQAPNPEGLYSNYLIMAKKDNGAPLTPSVWIGNAKSIYAGEASESAVAVNDRYKFYLRPKGTLNYTMSSLSPDTNYHIIVKTYMSANNIHYYDRGTTVLNCKTKALSLNFGGWEHVLSLGPRINGLADHRLSPSTERLSTSLTSNYSLSDVSFAINGIEGETLVTSKTITLPKVIKDDSKISSKDGLVQLIWKPYTSLDGRSITQYLFDEGISLSAGDGYYLYRKITPGFSTPAEYEAMLNSIQGSNSGWEALNETPLTVGSNNLLLFNDLLPNQFHPLNGDGVGEFRDRANTGRVVWYTVRFKVNGKLATIAENINKDAVIPVIIPPANMASVHHWMVNKKTCEIYNKEYDRNNSYRCLFGGMGSREIDGNYYFDIGGHSLIDRWSLGCNFNRFDDVKNCKNYSSTSLEISQKQGNYGAYHNMGTTLDGESYGKDGDCSIETSVTQYWPNADKGTVMFNGADLSCYYRVSDMLSANANNNQSNHWKRLAGGSLDSLSSKVNESILPKSISDEFLGRVYPQNSDLTSNKGIGDIISSNDSSLPPIVGISQNQAYYLCQSHAIKIRSGGNLSVPVRKRLISSQEHNVSSVPHRDTSDVEKIALEQSGNNATSSSSVYSTNELGYYYETRSGTRGSDSFTTGIGCLTQRNFGDSYNYRNVNKYTKGITTRGLIGQDGTPLAVTGSYDIAGLGNSTYLGTERCVSAFGIQDYIGSNDYWFNDQILCRVDGSGTDGLCDIRPNTNKINDYESLTSKVWPQFRYRVNEKKFYGQNAYTNALGNTYSRSIFLDKTAAVSSFGVPNRRATQYVNMINGISYPVNYTRYEGSRTSLHYPLSSYNYSFVNGEMINCDSGSCHSDDDINLAEMFLPSNMASLRKNYVEIEYFPTALVADSFYVKTKRRDNTKPRTATSYSGGSSYDQLFDLPTGINERVDKANITHAYSAEWKNGDDVSSAFTGARCAVKIELDLSGNVKKVDDQEQI